MNCCNEVDVSKTFIKDVAKMADFKVLTKKEFLAAYNVTEEEYEATRLYCYIHPSIWTV